MNYRKFLFHPSFFYLLPLVIFAITFFVKVSTVPTKIEIEIYAAQHDRLMFYLPNFSGDYTLAPQANTWYPQGESTIDVTLSSFDKRKPLRFDPGRKINQLTIKKLTVHTYFDEIEILGKNLDEYVSEYRDISTKAKGNNTVWQLNSRDAQIYFTPSLTALPMGQLFVLYLIGATVLVSLILNYRSSYNVRLKYGVSATVVVFTGSIVIASSGALQMALLLSLLLSLTLITIPLIMRALKQDELFLKLIHLSVLLVFMGIIVIPFIQTVQSPRLHKSILKNFNDFKTSNEPSLHNKTKNLVSGIENSFSKGFHYRKELINFNAKIKIFLFGYSPRNNTILGKNKMFFEGSGERRVEGDVTAVFDSVTDYMGKSPFTTEELEVWKNTLEERYYWLEKQGIKYIFAFAPTKAQIYEENYPDAVKRIKQGRPSRYDQLVNYLQEHSIVPVVNLKKHLIFAKKNPLSSKFSKLPLYYKTDFHWNFYGSFIAYQAIIDKINEAYPSYKLTAPKISDFNIHRKDDWVHQRFITMLGLDPREHRTETYLTFFPKPATLHAKHPPFVEHGINDNNKPAYDKKSIKGETVRIYKNDFGALGSIYLIGDSFSSKYFGFFSGHAKETVKFRAVTNFPTAPFEKNKPDIVIQEVLNMYLLQPPPKNPAFMKRH